MILLISIRKVYWIDPSVPSVHSSTSGNFLSIRAECLWNNDLDKNPNENTLVFWRAMKLIIYGTCCHLRLEAKVLVAVPCSTTLSKKMKIQCEGLLPVPFSSHYCPVQWRLAMRLRSLYCQMKSCSTRLNRNGRKSHLVAAERNRTAGL